MDKSNLHSGHRDRVRFRFERDIEMEAFNEHEMLEFLLFHAIPRKDTNELAHILINTFGSFSNVFNASVHDLSMTKGMTKNAALLIKSIQPLARAISISRNKKRAFLTTSDDSVKFLSGYFMNEVKEKAFVACLDINHRILDVVNIGKGEAVGTEIDLPKLLQIVSSSSASKVILMHNHPSGNLYPSEADILATNYAMLMLYSHKAKLVDHLIFSQNGEYFSFRHNQIIEALVESCNKIMAVDISSLYSIESGIAYHDKCIRLNDSMKQDYLSKIGNLFEGSDSVLKKLITKIKKFPNRKN